MKKIFWGCGLALLISVTAAFQVSAQTFDVQQLILDVQKLTVLKGILSDMKEGYRILDAGYSVVRDLSKGSFDLHKAFLDGLLAVSPAVRQYQRVADIVSLQIELVNKYQAAWGRFRQDGHFSPAELVLIGQVYSEVLSQSLKGLGDLVDVLTDGTMRASDAERLAQIDRIYEGMLEEEAFLDRFNNTTGLLGQQRVAEEGDLQTMKKLYVTP